MTLNARSKEYISVYFNFKERLQLPAGYFPLTEPTSPRWGHMIMEWISGEERTWRSRSGYAKH